MPRSASTVGFVRSRWAFFALLASAVVVGGVPVALSVFAPELNNSVVIAICASGQFFVSIFAGISWSKAEAVKEANMRWVPMAASACDRLATILGSVASLRTTVGQACGNATKNLPELAREENRAVRVHFEGLCSSNATRLNDVESHLDSALTDWERFIKHNCDGPECAEIGRRLAILRARLLSVNSVSGSVGCSPIAGEIAVASDQTPLSSEKLELMVSGVSTEQGCNGRWPLRQIEEGVWECETYILRKEQQSWFVDDRRDSESYFYRAEGASPCGVYERCEVCPHDGKAVVFKPINPTSETRTDRPIHSASPAHPSTSGDQRRVLNTTIALSEYLQHVVRDHKIPRETLIAAVTESSDLAEFSAMLGANCPNIVSVCAIPALNVMREALGRSEFTFDEELQIELCENASHIDTDESGVASGDESNPRQVAK